MIRHRLGIEPKVIKDELELAIPNHAPHLKTVYKWIKINKEKTERLEDLPRSGAPRTKITPSNIKLVRGIIEEDRSIGYDNIVAQTSLSAGTIHKIIHEELKMKKIASRWVPHDLTDENRKARVAICKKNLALIKSGSWRLGDILTGDESWFYHRHISKRERNKKWVYAGDKPNIVVRRGKFEPKTMFSLFFRRTGLVHLSSMHKGTSITSQTYVDNCLKPITSILKNQRTKMGAEKIKFHHDNARPHMSKLVTGYLKSQKYILMKHPPYSPDLAPCDFWLFDYIKSRLSDHTGPITLKRQITKICRDIPKKEWIKTFDKWVERMQHCIDAQGHYFEHLLK